MILTYSAIVILAVLPIYGASYGSLKRPASAPPPVEGDEEVDDLLITENLKSTDALFFPVFAGCALGSLYLLIKFVSQEWVNFILNYYFILMGFMSNTQALTRILLSLRPDLKGLPRYTFTAKLHKDRKDGTEIVISVSYLITGTVALVLSSWYAYDGNWIVSNIFGLCFAYNGIELLALDSFKTGVTLLSGLFLYDIYFVFGTEIMVTVAKGIEAPIKIVFPRDIIHNFYGPTAMLGLGDIVLPGVYIALALRYDLHTHHGANPKLPYRKKHTAFEKPYFHAVLVAYIIGLITTITAMHLSKSPQPALLYLSPACIFSTLITAWLRRDLHGIWLYKEESAEDAGRIDASNGQKIA